MIGLINNSITSSLSAVLIISHLDKTAFREYRRMLLTLILLDLSASCLFRPSLLLRLLLTGTYQYLKYRELKRSVLLALVTEAVILAEVLMIAPLCGAMTGRVNRLAGFEILTGCSLVLINLILRGSFLNSKVQRMVESAGIWVWCMTLTVMLACPFLVPEGPADGNRGLRQIAVYISLGVSILMLLVLLYDITKRQKAAAGMAMDRDAVLNAGRLMDRQYLRVMELRHQYRRLYKTLENSCRQDDMDVVRALFKHSLLPAREQVLAADRDELLARIESSLLRNLLYEGMKTCRQEGIEMSLYIGSYIRIRQMDELDLFIVLSEFINNAIAAVNQGSEEYIRITINQNAGLSIVIENSCRELPDLSRLSEQGYTTRKHARGQGLHTVAGVLSRYPEVEHFCYMKCGSFTQELYIGGQYEYHQMDNGQASRSPRS